MGMFDEILIKIKCEKCQKKREWRVQTKDLNCVLAKYNVGDRVDTEFPDLLAIGCCPNCGTQQFLEIKIKENIITDEYELFSNYI